MGTVTLPHTSKANTDPNLFSEVKANDQAIIDQVNGNLENVNIKSSAAIGYSKLATLNTGQLVLGNAGVPTATTLSNATLGATGALTGVTDTALASPNNSTYKSLLEANGAASVDLAAGTYILASVSGVTGSPATSLLASGGQAITGSYAFIAPPTRYFDDADYTVGSLTQKLRLRAQVNTNATAWSSVTATFGLYPVTFAGGADVMTMTLGTVVSGSTVAIANPSASTTNQGNSGDFTIPADGQYCIGVVTSATLTNNAAALLTAQLQTRNV